MRSRLSEATAAEVPILQMQALVPARSVRRLAYFKNPPANAGWF